MAWFLNQIAQPVAILGAVAILDYRPETEMKVLYILYGGQSFFYKWALNACFIHATLTTPLMVGVCAYAGGADMAAGAAVSGIGLAVIFGLMALATRH